MDLNAIAAAAGLTPEQVLDIARTLDTFIHSLTPEQYADLSKLYKSISGQPPAKRVQIQQFLASQVDTASPIVAGACILNLNVGDSQ